MKNLKKLLYPSLALLSLGLMSGCGGKATTSSTAIPGPSATPPPPGATPTPTPAVPSNAVTISDLHKLGGWENCTGSCTSTGTAVYSMTQGITSPSLSGSSTRFSLLSGTASFGGALWFKFTTNDNSGTHFLYDLFFMVDNASAPQALEFNVGLSAGGLRYNFSTQCDFAGNNWRVWEPIQLKWVPTPVSCPRPANNTWVHMVWEFQRDSAGHTIFSAVNINDKRFPVNITVGNVPDTTNGVAVAFQADANLTPALYSVWLDKVNLTFW